MRQWLQALTILSENLWLEVTLGSVRAESLTLVEDILWKHRKMTVLLGWDHFARLWPLFEWATFLNAHPPTNLELACDLLAPLSTIPLHLDRVRRLSIDAAAYHDTRDAEMLLHHFRADYRCEWQENVAYERSNTPRMTFNRQAIWSTAWAPLERFIRFTAVMVFARTMLRDHAYGSREAVGLWYLPWVHLAGELGFTELAARLKEVKPVRWYAEALEEAGTLEPDEEGKPGAPNVREAMELYCERINGWFERCCVPLYQKERALAVRPARSPAPRAASHLRPSVLAFSMPASSGKPKT